MHVVLLPKVVRLALNGDLLSAHSLLQTQLAAAPTGSWQAARLINNLAAVDAAMGDDAKAVEMLRRLRSQGQGSPAAARNLEFLTSSMARVEPPSPTLDASRQKVAILSLLFNWPSTGGGTVHTKELAENLQRVGYAVRHLYARYEPWDVGQVRELLEYPHHAIPFSPEEWNDHQIIQKFQEELSHDPPDWVIVTDSWNAKPLLVEAAEGYRTLIRIAAQECLCPLNNVRLLVDEQGSPQQCPVHQLLRPVDCCACVARNGATLSGSLHQAERKLVSYGTQQYDRRLRQAFGHAEGVLTVNPQIAEAFRPYARQVHVIPSGFDERRFENLPPLPFLNGRQLRILFAGLMPEFMKGFHILQAAANHLWKHRQDFEVWATGDAPKQCPPWLKAIGWQSQEQLPHIIRQCDLLVFPTIAQEALGRTAVEAMACSRPVIASDIGGLSWVVDHETTGLLCEPGNPTHLARQLTRLLDNAELRQEFGIAARNKFLKHFTWTAILQNHYLPLLGAPAKNGVHPL